MVEFRNPNLFEKILLVFGVLTAVVTYFVLHKVIFSGEVSTIDSVQTLFLWLILLVLIIMTSVNENMKEELKTVIKNQNEELKLLRYELKWIKK